MIMASSPRENEGTQKQGQSRMDRGKIPETPDWSFRMSAATLLVALAVPFALVARYFVVARDSYSGGDVSEDRRSAEVKRSLFGCGPAVGEWRHPDAGSCMSKVLLSLVLHSSLTVDLLLGPIRYRSSSYSDWLSIMISIADLRPAGGGEGGVSASIRHEHSCGGSYHSYFL